MRIAIVASRLLIAIGTIATLVGCSPGSVNHESEREALMSTSREWARASAGGDIERIVSYWADDAIVLPPDQPAVVGKAAIRDFVRAGQAMPGFSITWEPEQATVASSGDWGYLIERNRATMNDATGAVRTQFGKAVTVWRKDASGTWKCVVDTWNNSPQEKVLSQIVGGPVTVEAMNRVGSGDRSLPMR